MISAEIPLCLGASGSVRTNVNRKSASCAPDVHTFWPLTMKSSPSRTARVRNDARSEPALGSLIPSEAVISARSTGNGPALLLLGGSERDQRCCNDIDALRVETVVDASSTQFIEMDELLKYGCVASPEFWRLSGQ